DSFRPSAQAKDIALRAKIDTLAGPVAGDRDRLQQVVWNLVSNAVKFTPAGGRVDVSCEQLDGWIEIRVRDTGKGIAADFLPYVFDRFRQADTSTTRVYGGLGLGLSIVRYLAELHGGSVRAESPGEGRGATFRVRLPIAGAAAGDAEPVPTRVGAQASIADRERARAAGFQEHLPKPIDPAALAMTVAQLARPSHAT